MRVGPGYHALLFAEPRLRLLRGADPHLLETNTETVQAQNFEADTAPDTSTIITPRPLPGLAEF